MIGRFPAKFILCRKVQAEEVLFDVGEEALWTEHDKLSEELSELIVNLENGSLDYHNLKDCHPNLLNLKCELVNRMLEHCNFCEWNCRINRAQGKVGFCRLDATTSVGSYFHHYGEEAPLIGVGGRGGSGTIFFESCNSHCVFCIHPDSYVLTQRGPVRIAQLYNEAGFEIRRERGCARFPKDIYTSSAQGRVVRVTKIFRHDYRGHMIVIKPLYGPAIITTPEHEVLAADGPGEPLGKVPAGELSMRHWLAIPRPTFGENTDILDVSPVIGPLAAKLSYATKVRINLPRIRQAIALSDTGHTSFEIGNLLGFHPAYVRTLRSRVRKEGLPKPQRQNALVVESGKVRLKNERKPGIPASLRINEELAEFLGYFCAEGHISKSISRPSSYHVVLSFGRHEKSLALRSVQLLQELFGLRPYITERRTTITAEITKTSLALLLGSLCGTNAASKRVPSFLYQAPRSAVETFLSAFEIGDGCITGNHLSLNTISKDLAFGLFGLYLKLGHLPSIFLYHPRSHTFIEGRRVRQSPLYYVKVSIRRMREDSWRTAKHVRYSFADDHILVPLFHIGRVRYSGPVYNLEVDDTSHTYTANYIAIGNCQNWDISQPKTKNSIVGETVNPVRLAEITEELAREGAANINYVGGEPTVDLHTIINSLKYVRRSVPLVWNSNMYCSMDTMKILRDVVDLWLPDFKFWNDECAKRLMWVGAKASYPDTARRNHVFAVNHGSMIVRHLVLPGHVECCTKPILNFIAGTMGEKVLVNVMAQYYPANMVARTPEKYPDIARYPSRDEIQQAYAHARTLNLEFEQVS